MTTTSRIIIVIKTTEANNDEGVNTNGGFASFDIGLILPLTALGGFLVGALIFHLLTTYRYRMRRHHQGAFGAPQDGRNKETRTRRKSLDSNYSTQPSLQTASVSSHLKHQQARWPTIKVGPSNPKTYFPSKISSLVKLDPAIVHSEPIIHQDSTAAGKHKILPLPIEKLRKTYLSYSDPSVRDGKNEKSGELFGLGLYDYQWKQRAKSLELFEVDGTITVSASGTGMKTNSMTQSLTTCTCSLPTLHTDDIPPDSHVSLPSEHGGIQWNNNEIYVPSVASGTRAPQNSLLESSGNVSPSIGPGLDSDFGASAGVSQRIVSTDNSVISRGDSNDEDAITPTSCQWDGYNFSPSYMYCYVNEDFRPVLTSQQHWV